jgi:O-antigen/teichoic acid export membrane protein
MPKLGTNTLVFTMRQIFIFLLSAVVNIYTTNKFSSLTFGQFAILNSLVMGFSFFAEPGFFVGFIPSKEKLTKDYLLKIFTTTTFIFILLILLSLIIIPFLNLDKVYTRFIYATFIISYFTALQSIIFTKLQKEMDISKMAIIDIFSTLVYSATLLSLAQQNFQIDAFIYSLVAKATAGMILAQIICRIFFRPVFFKPDPIFLQQIKQGLINQVSYFLGFVRTLLNPIINGKLLGLTSVGMFERASFFAGIPVSIINLTTQRVIFPYLSELNNQSSSQSEKIQEMTFISSFIDKLYFIPLCVLFHSFTEKFLGPQWKGIEYFIYILSFGNALFGSIANIVQSSLMSFQRFKYLSIINIIQLLFLWPLALVLTHFWGLIGYSLTSFYTWLFVFFTYRELKKNVSNLSLSKEFLIPFLVAALTTTIGFLLLHYFPIKNLLIEILFFGSLLNILYVLLILLFEKKYSRKYFSLIRNKFRPFEK